MRLFPSGARLALVPIVAGLMSAGWSAAPALAAPGASPESATIANGNASETHQEMFPGDELSEFPAVVNLGPTAAPGAVMVFRTEDPVVFGETFSNCLYDAHTVVCRFEQELPSEVRHVLTDEQHYRALDDAEPGETVATIRWYALDELPADDPSLAGLKPGNMANVKLRATPGEPWGTPPSDTENISITIKKPKVDLKAIGDAVEGRIGDTVKITVGLKNIGTETKVGYDDTPTDAVKVTVPEGISVVKKDDQCNKLAADTYDCEFANSIKPGESRMVTFTVKIVKRVAGAEGTVVINPHMNTVDADRSNNSAKITVKITSAGGSGGGLADTGAPVGLVTTAGLLLLVAGVGARLLARRREDGLGA